MNIFDASISGSLSVSGSATITGDLAVTGVLYGTVSGSITNANTASYAPEYTLTSSFEPFTGSLNTFTSSAKNRLNAIETSTSSLNTITSSFHLFTSSYTTGSFTGSFGGNGSGLYNIPASGVTGLNLTQIAEGSSTASISQTDGLRVNSNVELTGSLKISNINLGVNKVILINVTDSGGKYFIDGVRNPVLSFIKGFTYKFLFPNIGAHPFRFSTTNDGTHNGGTIYSTGVTTGTGPDYIQIEVTDDTPSTLYYFCTSHTGMGNGIGVYSDFLNVESDRQVVYLEPSTIATTGSNNFVGTEKVSGSLSVTGSVDITGSISLNGQAIGTGKLDEVVFNSYTSSNDTTNSLQNNRLDGLETASGSIRTDFNSYTSSANGRFNLLESTTGSLNTYTSSANGRLNSLESTSGSLNSYTSSNTTNINAIQTATASLNTFSSSVLGAVEITGSNLTVKGNLLVKGTTTQIDSTTVNIGDNIIQLNGTAASSAGIQVQDPTGASVVSGSLLWDGSTDYWKAGKLGSEERIILVNEYNTFSTSIDSRATSLETSRTSLNSYTSSNNTRLNTIESTTSSLNTFTSSANGRLNSLETASGSIRTDFNSYTSSANTRFGLIETSTGSLNTFTSSTNGRLNTIESTTGSLNSYTSSNNSRLNTIESTTSSLNTFTSSANGRLNSLESASGSIRTDFNSYTSSNNTRVNTIESTTGSLNTFTSSASNRLGSLETASGSIRTDFNSYTSSTNTRLNSIETSTGSLNTFTSSQITHNNAVNTATSSLNSYTSSNTTNINAIQTATASLNTFTSSATTRLNSLETASGSIRTDFNSYTSSANGRLTSIETSTSSLNSFTSSINTTIKNKLNSDGVVSGSVQVNITGTTGYSSFSSSLATTDLNQENRLNSLEGKTGSYATTGSNIFQGSQTITGSLYISQDLIVAGSSSIQHISSSIVNIADNIITVNAQNPSVRFGGIAVIDSGSSPQVSGSMLFDSIENHWIYIHQNQSTITSSMLLMGPETFNNVGNETHLTTNRILKSVNDEHIGDSNITDNGTTVSINSNTEVTGTFTATGNISSPNITAIQTATGSLNSYTSSLKTAIELTGSNLTVKGDLLVKGTTTNVNTTTLNVDNNLITLNGTGATSAGIRVRDTTSPSLVSGSLLWDATNDYWVAGQLGSEQRLVRETEFNNAVNRIGSIETATSSLNTYTSSNNSRLNTIESTTSSLNTFTSSTNTRLNAIETSTGSLNTFTSSQNTFNTAHNTATASLNTFTSSTNTRLGLIETSTGSLNTFTSSASSRLTSLESASSSIRSDFNSFTSSNNSVETTQNNRLGALETTTGSLNTYTSSNNTVIGTLQTATSSLNSYTSSQNTFNTAHNTATASLNTFTSSANGRLNSLESTSSSLQTFSSSVAAGLQFTSSNVTVVGNLLVKGTTTTINSTTIDIADNIIQLNGGGSANGGLVVRDATASTLVSGSLLWNTTTDKWIAGPLGSEIEIDLISAAQTLTNKTISGASNTLSNIGNSSLTNSSITIAGTSTSLGGSITAATILSSTGVWSGSAQLPSGVVSGSSQILNGTTIHSGSFFNGISVVSGSAQITYSGISGIPSGIVSGSSQVLAGTTIHSGSFFNGITVVSGSAQIAISGTSDYSTYDATLLKLAGDQTVTGQKTFPSAIGNRPILGGGFISALTGDLNTDIWGISEDYYPSHGTAANAWGIRWSGDTNDIHFVGGGTNRFVFDLDNGNIAIGGTVTSGTWNGTSIGTAYTDAKVTSLTGTANQITVSSSTGAITLSTPQNIHTGATPTFAGLTSNGQLVVASTGTGGSATLKVNTSTAATFIHSQENFSANMTAGQTNIFVVGASGSTKNSGYIGYNWAGAGSNSNYVSIGHWGADHLLRVYGDGTIYMGTVTTGTWQGSSISTSYTDAKVTAVNAGTGVSVSSTTGSVTVSIGQSVATSASPTFAGLALGDGIYTYNDTNRDAGAAGYYPNAWTRGFRFSFANASSTDTGGNYSGVLHFHPWDGTTSSTGDASYQLAFGSTASNGGGMPQLRIRKGIDTTWNSWYRVPVVVTASFTSVTSVTVTHNLSTKNVMVMCYDNNDEMFWPSSIVTTSTSVVTITFATSRTGRVVVIG
jgi:hypothetical protein